MEEDKDLGIHEVRGDYRVFTALEQSLNCRCSVYKLNCSAFHSGLGCRLLSDNGEKGKTCIDTKRLEDSVKQRFVKKKKKGNKRMLEVCTVTQFEAGRQIRLRGGGRRAAKGGGDMRVTQQVCFGSWRDGPGVEEREARDLKKDLRERTA